MIYQLLLEKRGGSINRKLIEKADFLLSKEKGTIFKDHGGRISICLIYPNTYYIGMSNHGFQGIYHILNKRDDTVCERAFFPSDEDLDEHIRTKTPIFSLESKLPIDRFDIIAFSISFENDYPNIPKILTLSNIPLFYYERNKYHPILIAGGACMFFNPEPIASIFDMIFIGEGEEVLNEFINLLQSSSALKSKEELKKRAVSIKGIYIPQYYEITYDNDGKIVQRVSKEQAPTYIQRRFIEDLNTSQIAHSILSTETEFSNMCLVELMRGCQWRCRFCLVGHVYTPFRRKSPQRVLEEISNLQGKSRIGLVGPSLSDYPGIEDILKIEGVEFSITSLRANKKSLRLLELMKHQKSISIAPEAGSERLRRVINKNVSEEDILEISEIIFNSGFEVLRLYFMIGLPTEKSDDIEEMVKLVRKIRSLSNKSTIVLSISTFVPKPFTPFQWHPMESLDSLKRKINFLKKSFKGIKGIKVFHDLPKYAFMQGLFALGDRKVVRALKWMLDTEDWQRAMVLAGLNIDYYIFRAKKFEEILPWDFIEYSISKEYLWAEYMKALDESNL